MELIIENPEGIDYDDFTIWLCTYLSDNALSVVPRTPELEELWDQHFKDTDLGWQRDEAGHVIPPNVNYILHTYFDNLVVSRRGSDYIITCSPVVTLRGTSVSVDAVATMINEGNLSMPAYPYIDEIFDAVADGIDDFYDIYDSEEGA